MGLDSFQRIARQEVIEKNGLISALYKSNMMLQNGALASC
jgi:hypothetical protein